MPGLNDLRIEVLAGAGGALGVLVLDHFTDPNATNLPSHTPDKRPDAFAWGNQGTADFEVQGNKASMATGAGSFNDITIESEQSEVTCQCHVTMGAGADTYSGLFVRSTANDTGIECFLSSAGDFARITENNAGTRTDKVSSAFSVAPSTTYLLKVVCAGQIVTVYVNGAKIVEWNAATFNQGATRHGLWQWNNVNDSRWEDFQVAPAERAQIIDVQDELARAGGIEFSTGYPGGLYLDASMEIAREIVKSWLLRGGQRLRILNGQNVVYEGLIANLDRALQAARQHIEINATGHWGALLGSRRMRRLYADFRTSPDVWVERSGEDYVTDFVNIERYDDVNKVNRVAILPQNGIAWGAADRIRVRYEAPPGEAIARMEFDCEFSEGGQVWTTKLQDVDNAEATLYSRTTTGIDLNQSVEPAAGSRRIDMFLTSTNAQTTPGDQSVYASYKKIKVYAAKNHIPAGGKGTVDLTEIARDIRAEYPELSTDESLIASNTFSLKPFVGDRFVTAADILSRAASYGDASFNRWAVGIRGSHLAPDEKPILFVEAFPALSSFEYALRIDEPNLVPPFNIAEGYIGSDENRIWNFIVVEYADEQGFAQFLTPLDDANLKDQTSIDKYGQRDYRLSIGHGGITVAANAGRRFLAAHKDPPWSLKGPIAVKEFIRGSQSQRIPASEIQAGKRIQIENFLIDPATGSSDLIFLVTGTRYSDDDQVCQMTVGVPNSLDVYLAQRELIDEQLLGG
ncbi:MAG: hypothetical protein ACRD1K_20690 [Acidimicrobiales bacterium]